MWSDSTKEKFGDEHAPKWEKELRKLLCFTARLIIIIQTHFFSPVIRSLHSFPVHISPETHFNPELKITSTPFIFFLSFNNKQKE